MHCYLKLNNQMVDVTFPNKKNDITVIEEWKIEPQDILNLKLQLHFSYLSQWLKDNPNIPYNLEHILMIREECIQALGKE